MAEAKPCCLQDFRIGKPIGAGRFGKVYLATHIPSGATVALKTLSKQALLKEKCVVQLRREVEIQSRLSHPNILKILAYFHDKQRAYIVMEHCPEGELFGLLRSAPEHRLDEDTARSHVAAVSEALRYCHERHVLHRDIKPENLLLGSDGHVKLADFGWSIHAPKPFDARTTLCGTPEYLAPELAASLAGDSRSTHSSAADMWSLGCLAYELLFGFTPFHTPPVEPARRGARDPPPPPPEVALARRIMGGEWSFPSEPAVSDSAKDFMTRLIQHDPAARMTAVEACEHPWIVGTSHTAVPMAASTTPSTLPTRTTPGMFPVSSGTSRRSGASSGDSAGLVTDGRARARVRLGPARRVTKEATVAQSGAKVRL
jgi:serine/threonine protein kinase